MLTILGVKNSGKEHMRPPPFGLFLQQDKDFLPWQSKALRVKKQKLLGPLRPRPGSNTVSLLPYAVAKPSHKSSLQSVRGRTLQILMGEVAKVHFKSIHGIGGIIMAILGNYLSYCLRVNSNRIHKKNYKVFKRNILKKAA